MQYPTLELQAIIWNKNDIHFYIACSATKYPFCIASSFSVRFTRSIIIGSWETALLSAAKISYQKWSDLPCKKSSTSWKKINITASLACHMRTGLWNAIVWLWKRVWITKSWESAWNVARLGNKLSFDHALFVQLPASGILPKKEVGTFSRHPLQHAYLKHHSLEAATPSATANSAVTSTGTPETISGMAPPTAELSKAISKPMAVDAATKAAPVRAWQARVTCCSPCMCVCVCVCLCVLCVYMCMMCVYMCICLYSAVYAYMYSVHMYSV